MQRNDTSDKFAEACRNYVKYPELYLQPRKPQEVFFGENQWKNLNDKEEALFHGSEPTCQLDLWETGRHNSFPEEGTLISTLGALTKHLNRGDKDPHVRHLFLASEDSRSPLNCSMDMFKYVCSYHQVNPSFLESLYTFGEQTDPIDLCLAHFRAKETLSHSRQERLELPKLGRSGREINLSYLLRSVEYSGNDNGVWGWQVRQAANYHSFDLKTGRSFWFTIKGSDSFQKRIKKLSPLLDIPKKTDVKEGDVSPYLTASLATHIVYLSWCEENWRQFINDMDTAIRNIVKPASNALVDDHLDDNSDNLGAWPKPLRDSRKSTMYSKSQSRSSTNVTETMEKQEQILSRALNVTSSTLTSWLKRQKNQEADLEQGVQLTDSGANPSLPCLPTDPWGTLNKFRFKDMQSLHKHAEFIQKAQLVLDLNIGVLRDICEYYGNLAATEFKDNAACQAVVKEFQKDVGSISRMLETHLKQLQCLAINVSHSISLYERVLHQRTTQISTMFAEIAHENNRQMQDISDKTSKQTTSMHVITVATLFFLPATFVAVRAACPTVANLI